MNTVRKVLVVEDEYLLADELSRFLRARGFEVLGPAPSVARARALIDQHPPAAAVLDIQLGDERSYPIAEQLVTLGIPFVFRTGHVHDQLPDHLRDRPVLSKLTDLNMVEQTLSRLMAIAGGADER